MASLDTKTEDILDDWQSWSLGLDTRPSIQHTASSTPYGKVVCIQSGETKLALKQFTKDTSSLISRSSEQHIQALIALQGIGPNLLYASSHRNSGDYCIFEWVEGQTLSSLNKAQLQCILKTISSYKNLKTEQLGLSHYSYLNALEHYINQAELAEPAIDTQEARQTVRHYEEMYGDQRCLTHHDLNPANILWRNTDLSSPPECRVIDWEFAGLGIASFDLASVIVEFGIDLASAKHEFTDTLQCSDEELQLAIKSYRAICYFFNASLT